MKNAVCVNWGTKYGVEYTLRLYESIKRNTTYDFTFYCVTDNTTLYDRYPHIHAIEIDTDDTSWWCKLLLFKKNFLPSGDYLYLDLDVVIVDNIDCVFDHAGFGITRDFIRPNNGLLPGKEYNSSILRFNNTTTHGIYEYYVQNKQYWLDCQKTIVHWFGDQNLISQYVNHYPDFLNVFPDEWFWSYKKGVHRGKTAGDRSKMFGAEIPTGGKICVFHGEPNPDDVKNVDWITENYHDLLSS